MGDLFDHLPQEKPRGWPPADGNNYYFCAVPPPDVAALLFRHWQEVAARLPGRYAFRHDALHLSLLGLVHARGPVAGSLDQVKAAMEGFRHPPLDLLFDRIETLGQKAKGAPAIALCAMTQPQDALASRIYQVLRLAGAAVKPPGKTLAHVTLAYGPAIERHVLTVPLSWRVESFALVKSIQGKGRLEILGEWLLGR